MKCKLKDVMAVATRARIDGEDWIVIAGDETVTLRKPSRAQDPRVAFTEMKFDAEQHVQLDEGVVSATRSDKSVHARVRMWLFREVAITCGDVGRA